jgi:hypothetical protein
MKLYGIASKQSLDVDDFFVTRDEAERTLQEVPVSSRSRRAPRRRARRRRGADGLPAEFIPEGSNDGG